MKPSMRRKDLAASGTTNRRVFLRPRRSLKLCSCPRLAQIRIVHTCRTWGDAYGHILVATGRADVMLDPVMNTWDCAALLPIIEEAGGTFTDWRGERTIDGGNAISTNGKLFADVMGVIRKEQKTPCPFGEGWGEGLAR